MHERGRSKNNLAQREQGFSTYISGANQERAIQRDKENRQKSHSKNKLAPTKLSNTSIPQRTPGRYASHDEDDNDHSNPGEWNKSMNHRSSHTKDPKLPPPHMNKWELKNESDARTSKPAPSGPEKNSKVGIVSSSGLAGPHIRVTGEDRLTRPLASTGARKVLARNLLNKASGGATRMMRPLSQL